MSTKKSSNTTSNIAWPKTEQRKAAEKLVRSELRQAQLDKMNVVAQVGQMMTAASSIPSPHVKRLMRAAITEVNAAPKLTSKKTKNSTKRTTDEHREEYFETNRAWDEVNDIRYSCLDLLRTVSAITPLLRSEELKVCVENKRLLVRNISALGRDTQVMAKVMANIGALHADKSGGTIDQAEMVVSCEVYSQYVDFMERYEAALMPILVHTSEQLQLALVKLDETNPELAAQLNYQLQSHLGNVQRAIHEHTGADEQASPGAVPELTAHPAGDTVATA